MKRNAICSQLIFLTLLGPPHVQFLSCAALPRHQAILNLRILSTIQPKGDFCEQVWKDCKSTPISNSPFQPSAPRNATLTGSATMLTDFWQSENDFCASFSGTPNNQSVCFNGHGVSFNSIRNSSPSHTGICLEKIGNGSYLNMVAHPDGSSKAFFFRQDGQIWLAAVPDKGTQGSLQIDMTSPFLDLTNEGHLGSDLGLVCV